MSHNRVDATVLRSAVASIGTIRRATLLLVVTIMFALVGCSESTRPSTTTMATATATTLPPAQPLLASDPAQWRLASDPARLADDLVADEHVLRDPSSSEAVLRAVARRQQAAYYALGRHPEWDPTARSRIAVEDAERETINMAAEHGRRAPPPRRAPVQVVGIPISDTHVPYLEEVAAKVLLKGIRVEVDASDDRMQKKIRNRSTADLLDMLLAGDDDVAAHAVSFRYRNGAQKNGVPIDDVVWEIVSAVQTHSQVSRYIPALVRELGVHPRAASAGDAVAVQAAAGDRVVAHLRGISPSLSRRIN